MLGSRDIVLFSRARRAGQRAPLSHSHLPRSSQQSLAKSHQQTIFDQEAHRSSHAHTSKLILADSAGLTWLLSVSQPHPPSPTNNPKRTDPTRLAEAAVDALGHVDVVASGLPATVLSLLRLDRDRLQRRVFAQAPKEGRHTCDEENKT